MSAAPANVITLSQLTADSFLPIPSLHFVKSPDAGASPPKPPGFYLHLQK